MKPISVIVVLLAVIATCSATFKNANLLKPPCNVEHCNECRGNNPHSCRKCNGGFEKVKIEGIVGNRCRPWSRGAGQESPCWKNNGGCDPVSGLCSLTKDGSIQCACKAGFSGDGKNCTDPNECATNNGGCQDTCNNTPGSFYCSCQSGYSSPDGFTCVDDNECETPDLYCDMNASCTNTPGSYSCSCNGGLSGSGYPGDCY